MGPEIDLSGWGAVLVGIAAIIGSAASFYMAVRNTKKITDIDHAVNGRPKGSQTMQSQVDDIHSDRPKPPGLPPEMKTAAIVDKINILLADMYERQRNGS